MSTKADEQNAGATHGSERSAEQEGATVAEAAPQTQGLPSIIVDPALSELGANAPAVEAHAATATITAAPAVDGSAAEPSHATNGAAEAASAAPTNGAAHAASHPIALAEAVEAAIDADGMRFSDEDADRFAASFRPSWEPEAAVNAPPESAVRASLPALGPAVVVLPEPDLPIGSFSAADQRKRGVLMASGAVAGFFVLAGLAFSMSNRAVPNIPAAPAKPPAPVASSTTNAAPEAPAPTAGATPETANAVAPADLRAAAPQPAPADEAPTEGASPEIAANEAAAANTAPAAAAQSAAAPTEAPSTPEPAVPTAAVAPAAAPVAHATPERHAAPVVKEVHVRVAATPGSARILVDGNAVSNPYDAHAPAGEKHRVQIEAPGHTARDITLGFERDQKLTIKLERVRPAVAARPAAPARPAARAQAPARPSTPPVAASTMTITPRPAPAAPKPSTGKGAGFVNESPY